MANKSFLKGINAKFTMIVGGNLQSSLPVKNFSLRPDVTEVKDDLCGEQRTRLDVIVNFFGGSFDMTMETLTLFDAMLTYHDLKNRNVDLAPEFGFRIETLDGSAPGLYQAGGQIVFGAWDLGIQGRADRNSFKLPFAAQEFFKL